MNDPARILINKLGKRYTDIIRQHGTYELIKDQSVRTRQPACIFDS